MSQLAIIRGSTSGKKITFFWKEVVIETFSGGFWEQYKKTEILCFYVILHGYFML